jgi:two-component system, OmpR family, response regulator
MRILLVEDDKVLADALSRALVQSAHAVDAVATGEEADRVLALAIYDLAILDIGLPGLSGLEVLQRLRARKSTLPVLMLTALDTMQDQVRGLDLGADDYLAKPFDLDELKARIRALLRRSSQGRTPVLQCGSLSYDTNDRLFRLGNAPLALTPREHAVLETLIRGVNKTIAKKSLAESVFGFDDASSPENIEIYIHRVRKKLEPGDARIITLRGLGYLLKDRNSP